MTPDPTQSAAEPADPTDAEEAGLETPRHPARELAAHLLRMMETRIEAAGVALRTETRSFANRLQWNLIAGAGIFFTVWAGIVLLAIALPEDLRVPVLGAVVAAFAVLAGVAIVLARRQVTDHVGSMQWFVDGIREDLEVVARVLSRQPEAARPPADQEPPHDVAA